MRLAHDRLESQHNRVPWCSACRRLVAGGMSGLRWTTRPWVANRPARDVVLLRRTVLLGVCRVVAFIAVFVLWVIPDIRGPITRLRSVPCDCGMNSNRCGHGRTGTESRVLCGGSTGHICPANPTKIPLSS